MCFGKCPKSLVVVAAVEFVGPEILRIPFAERIHRDHNHHRMELDIRQHGRLVDMVHHTNLHIVEHYLAVRSFDKDWDRKLDFPAEKI